jgi:hypothetical protein
VTSAECLLVSYLSPEPLLQSPKWVRSELVGGHQVPTYAYARNNPVAYVDPTGNGPSPALGAAIFLGWRYWLSLHPNMIGEHPVKGNDKYAHCMANCWSATVGENDTAVLISTVKEAGDIAGYYCGLPSKKDQPPSSSVADFKANWKGLKGVGSCESTCEGYLE